MFKESQYLSLFQIKNSSTGEVFIPKTKEDLQLALFYLVKKELGNASSMAKSTEAQKAQAVCSYSFVLKYCTQKDAPYSFAFPSYSKNNANDQKIYKAIGDVVGVKIVDLKYTTLTKQLCETMYSSSTAGGSASNHYVFTSNLPYLQTVPSPYDNEKTIRTYFPGYTFVDTVTVKWDTLLSKLASKLGINASDIKADSNKTGMPLYATAWDGGEGNYVATTNLYYMKNNKKTYIRGYAIRTALGTGKMQSHAFTVTKYDKKTGELTLQTKGWGHGIGFSQTGATGFANEAGWTYDQILRHYFSITEKSTCQLVAPDWT